MKITLAAVTAITGLLVADEASAAIKNYKATFTATAGNGTGSAAVTYDDVAGKLCGSVTYAKLSGAVTGAHIHKSNSNVLVPLKEAASPMPINVAVTTQEAAEIAKQTTYINLHTVANGSGEIQGTLVDDNVSTTNLCNAPADAGADGSTTADGGSTSSSGGSTSSSGGSTSSGGSSSGGSNGATTERADSGTDSAAAPAEDDGGCSTSGAGGSLANGVCVAFGIGLAVTAMARSRRKRD